VAAFAFFLCVKAFGLSATNFPGNKMPLSWVKDSDWGRTAT